MAIKLAAKYEKKGQERYSMASKTDKYCGHDYEFTDVKTSKI